jgi:hypothetical protein
VRQPFNEPIAQWQVIEITRKVEKPAAKPTTKPAEKPKA